MFQRKVPGLCLLVLGWVTHQALTPTTKFAEFYRGNFPKMAAYEIPE